MSEGNLTPFKWVDWLIFVVGLIWAVSMTMTISGPVAIFAWGLFLTWAFGIVCIREIDKGKVDA